MHASLRTCLPLVLLVMAACSRSPEAAKPAPAAQSNLPTQAEVDRFIAEGPEPTLRKMAATDYLLHYRLMKATGIEQALGGEAQAIAALHALGDAYERKMRGVEADAPKMIPADFTGEGLGSGFAGHTLGFFAGIVGSMTTSTISKMSDKELTEFVNQGPKRFESKDDMYEFGLSNDGSLHQTMEFEVNEKGLNGKVKLKTRMVGCPDPDGKLTITVDVDSQMRVSGKAGTGGYVRSQLEYSRWLDDDANLIDSADGYANDMHIEMGGFENYAGQHVDINLGTERGGNPTFEHHGESGFSIFRPEEITRVLDVLKATFRLQHIAAEVLLRGIVSKPYWESGHCVTLEATSNPAKRTGIEPNTTFDIEARPRAKSDGAPTGGTVTATLSGGASLQPGSGKVPADAKYQYFGPAKENETASIAFEARSKRGVGRATLEFDTKVKKHGYRIAVGGGSFTACDITKPFVGHVGGLTLTFTPAADGKSGAMAWRYAGGGATAYTYTLSGPEESMTATYRNSGPICAPGVCAAVKQQVATSAWTRIEGCGG